MTTIKQQKMKEINLTTKGKGVIASTSNRNDFVIAKEFNNHSFVSVFLVTHSELSTCIVSPREQFVLFCQFVCQPKRKKEEGEVVFVSVLECFKQNKKRK
jgi:hypothetical protein